MLNKNNSFYKEYDILNNNRLIKLANEYFNPYGYNYSSNKRKIENDNYLIPFPNQDYKNIINRK